MGFLDFVRVGWKRGVLLGDKVKPFHVWEFLVAVGWALVIISSWEL
jgi:hypothetical protein